jgi:hypothetical protein
VDRANRDRRQRTRGPHQGADRGGNVRRLIIRNPDNEKLLEVPLTTGVVVGGAFTLLAPILAALGTMAALLARVKVEIVRTERKAEEPPNPQER